MTRQIALAVKRGMDVVGAAVGLVLLSPVLAATAPAVRVGLGRPILFRQVRPGRGGRLFTILKFRTMREPRPGEVWYLTNEARLTRLGRFLRETSLDELPELWNVLRGDMSLVGPRPEREVFLRELEARYPLFRLRQLVKPGLSGWAQLRYGYGSTVEEQGRKLEYDLYYIKHQSAWLDLVIMVRTVAVVLGLRGV
jgi:lipopolysaccharide/colanic/teichoic acid biosynthesis glycosyltransferase